MSSYHTERAQSFMELVEKNKDQTSSAFYSFLGMGDLPGMRAVIKAWFLTYNSLPTIAVRWLESRLSGGYPSTADRALARFFETRHAVQKSSVQCADCGGVGKITYSNSTPSHGYPCRRCATTGQVFSYTWVGRTTP